MDGGSIRKEEKGIQGKKEENGGSRKSRIRGLGSWDLGLSEIKKGKFLDETKNYFFLKYMGELSKTLGSPYFFRFAGFTQQILGFK